MTPEIAVEICRKAIETILMASAPMLIVALLVGLLVAWTLLPLAAALATLIAGLAGLVGGFAEA